MRIDSLATVLIALGTTVAATALLAHAWDRRRMVGRILLTVAVVLALTATAGLQLNRLTATYPTWASLLSPATGANLEVPEGAPPPVVPGGGRLARFTVPGPAGGLTLPMAAYLPAAYFSAQGRQLRFPVIEALHGFPGTPETWFRRLNVQRVLDREIAAGRMAPTVVLFPYQTPDRLLDTECTNLTDGPQTETYLTDDVPRWARDHLRVRTDRAGWALIGYSAGAFCAMNLALRHPGKYIAGASLSGYAGPGIKVGDGSEKTTNNIVWRLTHLPPPPVALYIAWARDDKASRKASEHITRLAKPPLAVTTATVARGGHSSAAWRSMEPPAFDWLSARLARAEPITAPARAAQSAQLRG